jgi:hypothetical protein
MLTHFVLDHIDQAQQDAISNLGLRTLVTNTVMRNNDDRVRLAGEVLEFVEARPK